MIDLNNLTREQKLEIIYRHTHPDFKNNTDGMRSVLQFRRGAGTCSIALPDLTEAEIADRMPYVLQKEWERVRKFKKSGE